MMNVTLLDLGRWKFPKWLGTITDFQFKSMFLGDLVAYGYEN